MAKEASLENLENKIDALTNIVEKGFAAVAGDIADMKEEIRGNKGDIMGIKHQMSGVATKEQMFALQTQVNSIEGQLRQYGRLEVRVASLEEKVFDEVRT